MKSVFILLMSLFSISLFAQKKLKVSEVYDYSIGDEISYSYCYESWNNNCNNLYTKFHKKVINKYYGPTGKNLFYQFNVIESAPKFLSNPTRLVYENTQYNQTIEINNLDSFILDLYFVDTTGTGFTMIDSVYINQDYNGKIVNYSYFSNNFEGGHSFIFVEGCGGWYGEEWFVPNARIYKLVYCKNGNSYFGHPVGEDDLITSTDLVKVYPNPLIGYTFYFTIPLNQFHTIQVFNLLGNEIINNDVNSELVQSITLPESAEPGSYFVKLSGKESVHCVRLIVN